jgi:hypothetical protein
MKIDANGPDLRPWEFMAVVFLIAAALVPVHHCHMMHIQANREKVATEAEEMAGGPHWLWGTRKESN